MPSIAISSISTVTLGRPFSNFALASSGFYIMGQNPATYKIHPFWERSNRTSSHSSQSLYPFSLHRKLYLDIVVFCIMVDAYRRRYTITSCSTIKFNMLYYVQMNIKKLLNTAYFSLLRINLLK